MSPGEPRDDVKRPAVRVVVVDDEPEQLRVLERALTREGLEVVTCEGAVAAFEALRADPTGFALLLTDIRMPGIDGLQQLAGLLGK